MVEESNGVKIVYDNSIKPYVNNAIIDHSSLWIMGDFYINAGRSGC